MLYRLVRPVKRQGSSRHQFVKRIPVDLKDRLVGMTLDIPLTIHVSAGTVRVCLHQDQAFTTE